MNVIGKAIDELFRYFENFNREYFNGELPDPVITIQKARPNNLGHFTLGKVWKSQKEEDGDELAKYEINVNPVNLNRPVIEIAGTIIHEMVHYSNTVKEIKDCNGQVHNKKFKTEAERVGLICEKSKSYGWGFTEVDSSLKDYINDKIKPDESVFEYFRIAGIPKEKKERVKKTFKYTCPDCGLEVKAAKDKNIKCADCEVHLEMENE